MDRVSSLIDSQRGTVDGGQRRPAGPGPLTDSTEGLDIAALAGDEGTGATVQIFRNVYSGAFDPIASSGKVSTAEGRMKGQVACCARRLHRAVGPLLNNGEGCQGGDPRTSIGCRPVVH